MPAAWEQTLAKWQNAGLIDPEAAGRIRAFEHRAGGSSGLRWPVIAALAFGGIMLAAGVLLFVSSHWEELGPAPRFAMVTSMVALFHLGGAFAAPRSDVFATTLHGIGTAALGAGIALSGQIFNVQEHWPSAILLWALGAWIGWGLRRDWLQLSFAAILTPVWVAAEWIEAHPSAERESVRIVGQGLLLLAITYFAARTRESQPRLSTRALAWIGGITLIPCVIGVALSRETGRFLTSTEHNGAFGYGIAYGAPLGVAYLLRRQFAWINAVAAVWVLILNTVARSVESPLLYFWCGLGAAGLVAWGMYEHRSERINLGMAGFAITVLCFYFSTVMDKVGRSASLIGLGVLFLAGGWALEKLRRRLVAQMGQSQ